VRFSLRRLGARRRRAGVGLDVACRRRGASRLRSRCRQVRRGSTPRNRHRRRRRALDTGDCVRGGVVRGAGSDARSHGADRHARRIQCFAHTPRNAARPERCDPSRGRSDRRSRADRRRGTCDPVRPSRHTGRRGRLCRPTRLASVAECPKSSPGTPDAARPSPFACCRTCASTARRAAGADSCRSRADFARVRAAGSFRRPSRAGRGGAGGRRGSRFRAGRNGPCSSGRCSSRLHDGDSDTSAHRHARLHEGASDAELGGARWSGRASAERRGVRGTTGRPCDTAGTTRRGRTAGGRGPPCPRCGAAPPGRDRRGGRRCRRRLDAVAGARLCADLGRSLAGLDPRRSDVRRRPAGRPEGTPYHWRP